MQIVKIRTQEYDGYRVLSFQFWHINTVTVHVLMNFHFLYLAYISKIFEKLILVFFLTSFIFSLNF